MGTAGTAGGRRAERKSDDISLDVVRGRKERKKDREVVERKDRKVAKERMEKEEK